MNYGTPIVSIVDYNLDVRQENPSLFNGTMLLVSSASSPIYANVVNLSSLTIINQVNAIGYVSNLPTVNAVVQGGVIQVNGGYLANISSLPPLAVSAISTTVTVNITSSLNTIPNAVVDKLYNIGTILNNGSASPFALGGAKQVDMGIVISSITGTSVAFNFSLVTVDGTLGVPYAIYNTSTFTTAGIYWMTVPQGNFLGDYAFVGYSVSGTSTALTGVWVRVVAK